jgi:hypothetical protein
MIPIFEDSTKTARQNAREFASRQVKKFMNPGKTFWQRFNEKYQNDHPFQIWFDFSVMIIISGIIALLLITVAVMMFFPTIQEIYNTNP